MQCAAAHHTPHQLGNGDAGVGLGAGTRTSSGNPCTLGQPQGGAEVPELWTPGSSSQWLQFKLLWTLGSSFQQLWLKLQTLIFRAFCYSRSRGP